MAGDQIVDSYDDWGVELPDGSACEAKDEADVDAIIQAAKAVNPRAKYKKIVRTIYVGDWSYTA